MSLTGKKILCVGGNGFIGNYFASRLIKSNPASVSILSRYIIIYPSNQLDLVPNINMNKIMILIGLLEMFSILKIKKLRIKSMKPKSLYIQ